MKFPTSARVPTIALLGIAAALLAGGVAIGAIPGSGGVIHGCYKKTSPNQGTLRVIDTDKGQKCLSSESQLTWNQSGPQGPPGPQGPAGPSAAFEKSIDGPLTLDAGNALVATLNIPQAGDYVISSKMYLTFDRNLFTSVVYLCNLQAGNDGDVTKGVVGAQGEFDGPAPEGGMVVNSLVHEFASPGTVDLTCGLGNPASLNFIKITAIRVGSLTTS